VLHARKLELSPLGRSGAVLVSFLWFRPLIQEGILDILARGSIIRVLMVKLSHTTFTPAVPSIV